MMDQETEEMVNDLAGQIVSLNDQLQAAQDALSGLDAITDGKWSEHDGSLLLSEDQWRSISDARKLLWQILQKTA